MLDSLCLCFSVRTGLCISRFCVSAGFHFPCMFSIGVENQRGYRTSSKVLRNVWRSRFYDVSSDGHQRKRTSHPFSNEEFWANRRNSLLHVSFISWMKIIKRMAWAIMNSHGMTKKRLQSINPFFLSFSPSNHPLIIFSLPQPLHQPQSCRR